MAVLASSCDKDDRVQEGGDFFLLFQLYCKDLLDGTYGPSDNGYLCGSGDVAFAEFFDQ